MDIFDLLTMLGGLCLFLLGMHLMSTNLELCAGKRMSALLLKFTGTPVRGFLLGLLFTLVIQSSSATTVMVVGFVSAGMMTLRQSVGVILGANLGTTITSWMIAMTGLQSNVFWLNMLKPSSFTPLLALAGILLLNVGKSQRKKEIGLVLLGFTVLIFGIETMSGSVSGLRDMPAFNTALRAVSNPFLAILFGTLLTMLLQSSSASIGILQALCVTGSITGNFAIPMLLGLNFGACITALLAAFGASREAKRAALVHLYFNLVGKSAVVGIFYIVSIFADFSPILNASLDPTGIALVHTAINLAAALLFLPLGGLLLKLVKLTVRDAAQPQEFQRLDEHLLSTPSVALANCRESVQEMAGYALEAMQNAIRSFVAYDHALAKNIRERESLIDRYEDHVGSYLLKISSKQLSARESSESTELLRVIGDFERISDHAVNLLESAEEIREKKLQFSEEAEQELQTLCNAVNEILLLADRAFCENDGEAADSVEPLEQVIDDLRQEIRLHHTLRMQKNECSIEHGFVLSDILTNLERVSDHCSNIAGCVLETGHDEMDMHRFLSGVRAESESFLRQYHEYREKYTLSH